MFYKVTSCEMERSANYHVFSKDNRTFVLRVMSARLQLQSFTCFLTRFTLPQKQYRIRRRKPDKTFHFRTRDTSHYLLNLLTSFSSVPFEPKV